MTITMGNKAIGELRKLKREKFDATTVVECYSVDNNEAYLFTENHNDVATLVNTYLNRGFEIIDIRP